MDFDFAKVVEASRDNPVWYLQYAHARISRLRQKAADAGIALPDPAPARLNDHELGLVKLLAQFPRMVEAAASAREPHRIAFYLADVAASFHAWYNLGNDEPEARIVLANDPELRSEEHPSELQSLMRISYAVFCLKKKKTTQ